jgi:NAD(P)-dependent dehydrogenase (short-subunit alcohol dehydrogenase family)
MKKVLITGAGTGFGHEAAIRLADKGFDAIASVEIWAQKETVDRDAKARGVKLRVEKLDVTNAGDLLPMSASSWRTKATRWPPASTTAMLYGIPKLAAFASAADNIHFAS